uniref:GAF domain-containing protein n=1 Tax=Hemiselmis andersenii TaxID=464988 RepID=A0A6U4NIS8_HEMAN|mmetsp:Transcript_14339/g.33165  ORF Transcript_14339/g.33165 Transcript_14339/m.33165 type:complete len:497 (-) Transcript_14339:54-1544(-)
MDAQYLQENVGPALTAGLASVAAGQPDDPVDYLAHWLLKYLAVQDKKEKVSAAQELITKEKEAAEAADAAKVTAKEERFFKLKKALEEVAATTSFNQMYDVMVKTAREQSNSDNVYLMLLEQTPPPEGQEEDPEPEQEPVEPPPEPEEGEEPAPVPEPEKLDPWLPKFTTLRVVTANEENKWMVGKTVQAPAYGKQTVSYSTVDSKELTFLPNVMVSEPPITFFDMPMPGSFAAQPVLKGEDEKYKAGGVLGLLCVDTVGGDSTKTLTDEDKELLLEMGRVAGSTFERLMAEKKARKAAEDDIVAKLLEALVIPEEQEVAEEDEVDALEGKLAACDTAIIGEVKKVFKEQTPPQPVGEYGRSLSELSGWEGTPSGRVAAMLYALVQEEATCTPEDLEGKIQSLDIKTLSEETLAAAAAALNPEGADPITKETEGLEFPAQLCMALMEAVNMLKDTSLKIQKIRKEEEEARIAEEERIKKEEEEAAAAAAAEAAPAE